MKYRFVLFDRGLDSNIYKIAQPQTARLRNEIGDEKHEIYEDFNEAKEAALLIIGRYDGSVRRPGQAFVSRSQEQLQQYRSKISNLTEEGVETFFF